MIFTKRKPLFVLCLVLSACAQNPAQQTEVQQQMQQAFELPASETALPPAEVRAALIPPMQINLPGISSEKTETRFDVKVRRLRARDFFLSLVEGTPYNMVIHPKVGGYISLDLKNTTVPETMQVVRSVLGYDYKINGDTIQVFPNTIHTRIFKIDYLAVKRTGESLTTSKTGQITNGTENGGNNSNSSTIQTGSDANFWVDLKESLSLLLGSGKDNRVSINAQTGIVMVRAAPSEMRIVEEYLKASQSILHRQVILEARILEVTLDDGFQSGINWAALQTSGTDSLTISQVGGGSALSGGYASTQNNAGSLDPAAPVPILGSVTEAFGGVFSAALNTNNFTAFIELLKTQGDVQVLSSPRVSTINNQKAVIKVGNDEFFVTNINSQNNVAAAGGTTQVSVDLDPFFSGVALDVIPQISAAGDVVLHVHPAVSEVREQTKTVATTLGTLSMPLAASNIRESDTVIRAANGQVVVIGGLMQNSTEDEQSSVPLLGDIPLLGGLFRHTRKAKRKSELVILLKPTVIDADGQVWKQQLRDSSSSFNSLGEGF